jgi:hypothetical protein
LLAPLADPFDRATRMAMLGIETDPEQVDQRMQAAVKLFLNGVRPEFQTISQMQTEAPRLSIKSARE